MLRRMLRFPGVLLTSEIVSSRAPSRRGRGCGGPCASGQDPQRQSSPRNPGHRGCIPGLSRGSASRKTSTGRPVPREGPRVPVQGLRAVPLRSDRRPRMPSRKGFLPHEGRRGTVRCSLVHCDMASIAGAHLCPGGRIRAIRRVVGREATAFRRLGHPSASVSRVVPLLALPPPCWGLPRR